MSPHRNTPADVPNHGYERPSPRPTYPPQPPKYPPNIGRPPIEMAKKTRTDYRDSVDGLFVTKKEAESRPRETTKERNPLPTKSK